MTMTRAAMLGERPTPSTAWAAIRSVRMPRLVLWWVLVVGTYCLLVGLHGEANVRAAWWQVWTWREVRPVEVVRP